MFCKNCGNGLSDGTKFCSACGTAVEANAQAATPVQQAPAQPVTPVQNFQATTEKPKSKGKKIGGIVMVVLGALAFLGGISNGFFENISANGADASDIVTILLEIGLVAGGAYMIYKSKNQE